MTDTHIGKTIYIATEVPSGNSDSDFAALTWVLAKGVQVLPKLGTTHEEVDIDDLGTGFSQGKKGKGKGVTSTMTFRHVEGDSGQQTLIDKAEDQEGLISVMIVKGSGAMTAHGPAPQQGDPVEYAKGFVHSHEPMEGNSTTHEGFSVSFRQNDKTVRAAYPV